MRPARLLGFLASPLEQRQPLWRNRLKFEAVREWRARRLSERNQYRRLLVVGHRDRAGKGRHERRMIRRHRLNDHQRIRRCESSQSTGIPGQRCLADRIEPGGQRCERGFVLDSADPQRPARGPVEVARAGHAPLRRDHQVEHRAQEAGIVEGC